MNTQLIFKTQTGFIIKEDAIKIVNQTVSDKMISQTTFVLLKYEKQNHTFENYTVYDVTIYGVDPYSKTTPSNGTEISILCQSSCSWGNETHRFAWSVTFSKPMFGQLYDCNRARYVDAITGQYIGFDSHLCL